MAVCSVKDCGISADFLLYHIDNGKEKVVFCPNHAIMYFLDMLKEEDIQKYPSELPEGTELHCEICGKEAVQFKEFKHTLNLCDEHLEKINKRNLNREEFFILYNKYPDMYLIHDDFYDPDTGVAFQPVEDD